MAEGKGEVMGKKVIYASDLDNTLIFSEKFVEKYPCESPYEVVETYTSGHSIMSKAVKEKVAEINEDGRVQFVPVTTRDLMRYNRINLGFKPEYAIIANGGIILHNGEPIEEWTDYVKAMFNYPEAVSLMEEIETEMESVGGDVQIVDSCYLIFKTEYKELFDQEVMYFIAKYTDWDFIRQNQKCYAIPKHFSKQIALRWLWNHLDKPKIVASGDSELDVPMLSIADRAIVPEHSSLLADGIIEDCTKAPEGIESALFTIQVVQELADK